MVWVRWEGDVDRDQEEINSHGGGTFGAHVSGSTHCQQGEGRLMPKVTVGSAARSADGASGCGSCLQFTMRGR